MMNRWLSLFLFLFFSCGPKEVENADKIEYEIFGVTDFKVVSFPLCVWLNDEPVFNLGKTSTYPRISNSYPIRISENHIKITPLLSDSNEEVRLTDQLFFYSNGPDEEFIVMNKNPNNFFIEGVFQGKRNYDLDKGINRIAATEEVEGQAKKWVIKYLKYLRDKEEDLLLSLFAYSPKGEDWFTPVNDFLLKESVCISLVTDNEVILKRGNSVILVCSNEKLAEWQIGATNRRIENFLFCSTDSGLFMRVSGGKWVKTRSVE